MSEFFIDSMKKCTVEGCDCLAEICNIKNGIKFRRKYCSKHKMIAYGMKKKSKKKYGSIQYGNLGKKDKCLLCGWVGPCDAHRMDWGQHYNMDNMASLCPNCHRLIHRGLITITDEQRLSIITFNKDVKQMLDKTAINRPVAK